MFAKYTTVTAVAILALAGSLGAGFLGNENGEPAPAPARMEVTLTGGAIFAAQGPGDHCWGPNGWDPNCGPQPQWGPNNMMGPGPGHPGAWGPGMMGPDCWD